MKPGFEPAKRHKNASINAPIEKIAGRTGKRRMVDGVWMLYLSNGMAVEVRIAVACTANASGAVARKVSQKDKPSGKQTTARKKERLKVRRSICIEVARKA